MQQRGVHGMFKSPKIVFLALAIMVVSYGCAAPRPAPQSSAARTRVQSTAARTPARAVVQDRAPGVSAGRSATLGVQVKPITGVDMRTVHMQYGRGQVVVVSEVTQGSPAEQMGIKEKDVILSVNYRDIGTPNEFTDAVSALNAGDRIVLMVSRFGEKAQYITGTMGKSAGLAEKEQLPKPSAKADAPAAGTSARIFAPTGNHKIVAIAFSPDGKQVLSGGDTKNALKLWDISTAKEAVTFTGHGEGSISAVAVSPDGRYVLSGSFDKTMKLWEASTGKEVWTAAGHTGIVLAVAFSPDGRVAASGSRDNTVKLWEVASGKEIRTFTGHSDGVKSIAFSPDGRSLLSGSYDQTLKLWDVSTGRASRTFKGHAAQVHAVAISADGRQGLSRSGDRIIKLWDLQTGRETRTFSADEVDSAGKSLGNQMVVSGTFSTDGKYMLTTNRLGTVIFWDVAKGKAIRTFPGHTGWVQGVNFSNDMKRLISGGQDGTIRIWDIGTGREIGRFISLKDREWIALTPEGYYNSSQNAHKYLNIRMGNKVYGIDQFYDVFYRPDIVAAKLRGDDISSLVTLTIDDALRNPPPMVGFAALPRQTDQPKVNVCYQVRSTGGGIGEVRLFHNGKLIESDGYYKDVANASENMQLASLNSAKIYEDMRSVKITASGETSPIKSRVKGEQLEECKMVDAIPGENEISLSAFNSSNTVQSYMQTATFNAAIKPEEPRLYILSIGIDEYKDQSVNLRYAYKDAKDIEEKLLSQSETLYKPSNIHHELIQNREATKPAIMGRINEISQKITPYDSFILFVAGHGVLLQNQYYMLTHDYDGTANDRNMISSNEIVEMSKKIKSLSQLFIFDTCHAGGVDYIVSGLYDARMSVLAKKMGLHIYASANDKQSAMDGYKGNGLFTHTLLDGLNNNRAADENKDGKVSVVGLGGYSKKMTTDLSKQIGHAQTPLIINFGKDYPLYRLK